MKGAGSSVENKLLVALGPGSGRKIQAEAFASLAGDKADRPLFCIISILFLHLLRQLVLDELYVYCLSSNIESLRS